MKNIIIFLSLFLFAISLFGQEPTLKFFLNDGNFKSFDIDDIDSLAVSKSDSRYILHIYYQDTNIAYYPNEIIQCVKIEKDINKQLILNVYIFSYPKPYLVSEIDSIVFKIDQWQPLTIGSQVWMLKNLDVDHYRNGDSIPEVRDSTEWANLKSGAWCYYLNDTTNGEIYGKLYNWYALNDPRGICPEGWHIPTDNEWKTLEMCLGISKEDSDKNGFRGINEGGKLKESGTGYWQSPNTGGTNESGFTALPGGVRDDLGTFNLIGLNGFWWSATMDTASPYWLPPRAWGRRLDNIRASIIRAQGNYLTGKSVRCVKD